MKGRFSEEQMIGLFKQQGVGVSVAQLCREHKVSQAIFYKWNAKFGGMNVSEAKRASTGRCEGLPLGSPINSRGDWG